RARAAHLGVFGTRRRTRPSPPRSRTAGPAPATRQRAQGAGVPPAASTPELRRAAARGRSIPRRLRAPSCPSLPRLPPRSAPRLPGAPRSAHEAPRSPSLGGQLEGAENHDLVLALDAELLVLPLPRLG